MTMNSFSSSSYLLGFGMAIAASSFLVGSASSVDPNITVMDRFAAQVEPSTVLHLDLMQAESMNDFLTTARSRRRRYRKDGRREGKKSLIYLQLDPIDPYYQVDVFHYYSYDFCYTLQVPRRHLTPKQKEEIKKRMEADYAAFDSFEFTTEEPKSNPFDVPYSTVQFFFEPAFYDFSMYGSFFQILSDCDSGSPYVYDYYADFLGGLAENIDFLNTNKKDRAVLDSTDFIDFLIQVDPSGRALESYFPLTRQGSETVEEYVDKLVVNGASNIGSHELGHILGLRHHDSFGPIGKGKSGRPNEFLYHLMNSPAFTWNAGFGDALADQVFTNFYSKDSFFSERSALKIQMSLECPIISEDRLKKRNLRTPMRLPSIVVPNTLLAGDNADLGDEFLLKALAVYGSIGRDGEVDTYDFKFQRGSYLTIEVISLVDDKFVDFIDPIVRVFYVDENNNDNLVFVGFNDDDDESYDSLLLDLPIRKSGTYKVSISAYPYAFYENAFETGDYALYLYTGTNPLQTPEDPNANRRLFNDDHDLKARQAMIYKMRKSSKTSVIVPASANNYTGGLRVDN